MMSFAEFLIRPPATLRGVLAFLGAGIIASLLSNLLGLLTGNSVLMQIFFVAYLLLVLMAIYLLSLNVTPKVLVSEDKQPAKHRGLILLVGIGRPGENPLNQSAWKAIEYHLADGQAQGLQTCWLIGSGGAEGSLSVAEKLKQMCEARNVKAQVRSVEDTFGVQETYDLVMRIYRDEAPEAGLGEQEVIADFTGAVKPMSAGMILACGERRPMQYMVGRKEGVASIPRLIEFKPSNRRRA